ncbi:2-phospho-L-lactate guanylyltransferase [Microbacteriaceae bacterium VKM Ac-2855]|nr:2-phospho-L-lactate guanylyltransferase [Microbacteriaceae bacterium VKM Ac-2855]
MSAAATRWSIVVPVKGTPTAKSRLGSDPQLAEAIAADTVAAALVVARVLVVTAGPMTAFDGAEFIADPGRGLGDAIAAGVRAAGSGPVAVLLGDLPALLPVELSAALAAAQAHPRAMVPDADGIGTVLVTARSGHELVASFGDDSRAAHRAAGYVELEVAGDSGLRRDVDTIEHLAALFDAGRLGARTAARAAAHVAATNVSEEAA